MASLAVKELSISGNDATFTGELGQLFTIHGQIMHPVKCVIVQLLRLLTQDLY